MEIIKKRLFLLSGALIMPAQSVFAAVEEVSPELQQALKTTTNEPNIFSIIFALGFVIFLIYITGLIYSKLNVVGAKAVKEQLKNYELTKAVILSTTQIGQGKNLHVIEVNNNHYLIGATQNSINLIKDLGNIKEESSSEKVKPATEKIDDAMDVLYSGHGEDLVANEDEKTTKSEFDIHKKYL